MNAGDRVALVTGASRGLGAAIAIHLATEGFTVAVNHRNSADLAENVVSAVAQGGGKAAAFAADVTDEEQTTDLVARIEEQLGEVTVVIANATGPQPTIGVEDLTWTAIVDQMNFFVKSPTLLLNAALPAMKRRRFGRFVHIASDVVDLVPAGSTAYVCAKAAQRSLARSWAKELGQYGITVNTVSPGWVPVERHADVTAETLEQYAKSIPVRRMGEPDDIANAVAFLSSDQASFVTGQNLTVNGGKTLV